jgi:predicted PurR-regulated permease PerM
MRFHLLLLHPVNRSLAYLVLFLAAFGFLAWFFSDIFLYIVLSVVLSAIMRPLVTLLSKFQVLQFRMPRVAAIFLTYLTFGLLASLFVLIFIPLISDQMEVLVGLNYDKILEIIAGPVRWIEQVLLTIGISHEAEGFLLESIKVSLISSISELKFGVIVNEFISVTGSIFVAFMAVSFITFFLLYELGPIRKNIIALIPNQYFEVSISAFNKIEQLLSNYLVGLLIQMTSIFTLASIGLSIFGVKYALSIALFAALANLIPYLGPLLGASFGVIVAISTGEFSLGAPGSILHIISILGVFGVVQITDNVVLQPLIFSKSVKAHPLEIFIIIFAGASLAGIPGMIAAIPVYTILRVSVSELYAGYKQYTIFKIS